MFFLFQYCIENCKKDIKWFCNKLRRVGHLCYWIKTTIQTSNFFTLKNAKLQTQNISLTIFEPFWWKTFYLGIYMSVSLTLKVTQEVLKKKRFMGLFRSLGDTFEYIASHCCTWTSYLLFIVLTYSNSIWHRCFLIHCNFRNTRKPTFHLILIH